MIRENKILNILYKIYCYCLYFTPIILNNIITRKRLLLPIYDNKNKKCSHGRVNDKLIIYCVQKETTFSGGLSDRLRAITSIYKECKRKNLPFRILFEPLHLEDYLEPNEYDWILKNDEICYDTKYVYPCTLLTYRHNTKNKYMHFVQNTMLRYYIKKDYKQIHIYSNMVTQDNEYGILFKELFKPSSLLESNVDLHLKAIGGSKTYIAIVFRFRQLLGDFKEGGNTLYGKERDEYLNRCVERVKTMHDKFPNKKILVTSDSITFLNAIKEFPYIYVIPGKIVHISATFDADKMTYMKSFIDYYMLSYASTIYLVRDKLMYHSGFAYRAALLNNAEYKEICL